ncbi:CPBP family intramembrane metalloprotease [Paenibacillus sp. GSMTC-2017]|uniref:CPBP family intramembrane glutamic endopeptidase n=1 Tax=Paenibacillus sp. GSMTC-2017 TaxID=2794350 RepID=UPI0018D6A145|nr:CPBP family intramembrane glutamic endopeptidase [Paenibacillus sp. GSMTC-2017]MBH5316215.1 CPBP family intramembrane metalloprotease [Paenibacillus sp. GSMTC-2017]
MHNEMDVKQYSVFKIVGLWAVVALPMFILRFVVMPLLIPIVNFHPGILYWLLMIIGMIWQFVLSIIILKCELGHFTWKKLKQRLWLNHPIHPKTFKIYKLAYAFTIPIILYAFFIESSGLFTFIAEAINRLFPFIAPHDYTQIQNLATPEFEGAWYLLGIALVSCLFNYLLGEELFFRGVLLPKMKGAFGKWDWAANGILFAAYHLHKISEIPLFIVGSLFYGYLNVKYRSFWPTVVIHGVEAISLLLGVLAAILGFL